MLNETDGPEVMLLKVALKIAPRDYVAWTEWLDHVKEWETLRNEGVI
jgi:hypothetical protein